MEFLSGISGTSRAGQALLRHSAPIDLNCQHDGDKVQPIIPGMWVCTACNMVLNEHPRSCYHMNIDEETLFCVDCGHFPPLRVMPDVRTCEHSDVAYVLPPVDEFVCQACSAYVDEDSLTARQRAQLKASALAHGDASFRLGTSALVQEVEQKLVDSLAKTAKIRKHRARAGVNFHGRVATWVDTAIPTAADTQVSRRQFDAKSIDRNVFFSHACPSHSRTFVSAPKSLACCLFCRTACRASGS